MITEIAKTGDEDEDFSTDAFRSHLNQRTAEITGNYSVVNKT